MLRIRDVENVEIAMLMREKEPNVYKVSMRAKEYANVCAVAERYGGGGHRLAAGCTVRGELDALAAELTEALIQAL